MVMTPGLLRGQLCGRCLSQAGPLVTLSGLQSSTYTNTSFAADTKFDARTAQFKVGTTPNNGVRLAGGSNGCWVGGEILGEFPPDTSWTTMHDKYGLIVRSSDSVGAAGIRIHKARVFNYGDNVAFDAQGDTDWHMCGCYLKYARDDGIENDWYNNGTIRDCFIDGCYDGISAREYGSPPDGSGNLITIENSLIRLQGMDSVFGGSVPNHNAFWKWHANAPQIILRNVVFRADSTSQEGNGAGMYMAPPPGKCIESVGNTMVWLGQGSFPETLPGGFTLLTGQTGIDFWNEAAAAWLAGHAPLTDIADPIVSMFQPGVIGSSTLTGSAVTLVATAVDYVDVVGVQFKLDGLDIGSEQTAPTDWNPTNNITRDMFTKYKIVWDSTTKSNGSYTLTATARDAAGHSKTSAGVAVTVSN